MRRSTGAWPRRISRRRPAPSGWRRGAAPRGKCGTAWRRTSTDGTVSSKGLVSRSSRGRRELRGRMAAQPLGKIASGDYAHTRRVKSGEVPIDGVRADFIQVVPIIGAFRRMVRDLEFDICEMAPTTYLIARTRGAPSVALPIFLMRRFHHGGFLVRPDAAIRVPRDLEGKKVGVRAYSVTTGVWTRGIFVNEYGLDASRVTWVVDDEEHVSTLELPPHLGQAPPGQSLQSMMASGEIQAGFAGPAGVGRAGPPISGWDKATAASAAADTYPELIADAERVEAAWFRDKAIYPIHSLVVVKDALIGRYPWLAHAL